MFKEANFEIEINEGITFNELVKENIFNHKALVEEISKKADNQLAIEKKLRDIEETIKKRQIITISYKQTSI